MPRKPQPKRSTEPRCVFHRSSVEPLTRQLTRHSGLAQGKGKGKEKARAQDSDGDEEDEDEEDESSHRKAKGKGKAKAREERDSMDDDSDVSMASSSAPRTKKTAAAKGKGKAAPKKVVSKGKAKADLVRRPVRLLVRATLIVYFSCSSTRMKTRMTTRKRPLRLRRRRTSLFPCRLSKRTCR